MAIGAIARAISRAATRAATRAAADKKNKEDKKKKNGKKKKGIKELTEADKKALGTTGPRPKDMKRTSPDTSGWTRADWDKARAEHKKQQADKAAAKKRSKKRKIT